MGAYFIRPELRGFAMLWEWLAMFVIAVQTVVKAVAYRAYAIRPYNYRNTLIAHSFQNTKKICLM